MQLVIVPVDMCIRHYKLLPFEKVPLPYWKDKLFFAKVIASILRH